MDYEAMLKKAEDEMPELVQERERFEIPKIMGHLEGNKTKISNLNQISNTLRRNPDHLFKYLLKELATPGTNNRSSFVFGAKISASKINDKIKKYADELVFCRECGKPDTKLIDEDGTVFLKCSACGTKYPVKTKL